MTNVPCPQCGVAVEQNVPYCGRCGATLLFQSGNASQPVPQGACFGCGTAAFGSCQDCGRFFCLRHGGMDWLRYPSCNSCRKKRRILLLIVLPLTMIVAIGVFIAVRRFIR